MPVVRYGDDKYKLHFSDIFKSNRTLLAEEIAFQALKVSYLRYFPLFNLYSLSIIKLLSELIIYPNSAKEPAKRKRRRKRWQRTEELQRMGLIRRVESRHQNQSQTRGLRVRQVVSLGCLPINSNCTDWLIRN